MLNKLADGVFEVTSELKLGFGFILPIRSTVLVQSNGEVTIVSPIRFDEAISAAIDALGPVTRILAPNKFHHLFLGKAAKRWPSARVHAAPGLAEKRKDLEIHEVLATGTGSLGPDLSWVEMEGSPAVREIVVVHKPSRTLVVTDLVFNVTEPRGFMTGIILRIMGTYGRLAQSRLVRLATKDRAKAAASVRRLLELDFDRLLVAHGDVIERGAKEKLTSALSGMMKA